MSRHCWKCLVYLGFHLGSLFRVNSQHMLVMTNGVQAIFVLGTDITAQSLQNTMWLPRPENAK